MKLMNVEYTNITISEGLENFFKLIGIENKKSNVFFLNADCLYKAQFDDEYLKIINGADILFSDGIGLRVATRLYGGRMKDNCNGTDLSPLIMKRAAEEAKPVYLLGGKKGIAEKAAKNMMAEIPDLNIVGTHDGYFKDEDKIIEEINNSKADILFVAMGAPLQEKWIIRNREKLSPKVCLGVGALFDYLSKSIPRAPKWLQKLHLEWFWRIFIDPKRMFKRYFIDGLGFIYLMLKMRFISPKKSA